MFCFLFILEVWFQNRRAKWRKDYTSKVSKDQQHRYRAGQFGSHRPDSFLSAGSVIPCSCSSQNTPGSVASRYLSRMHFAAEGGVSSSWKYNQPGNQWQPHNDFVVKMQGCLSNCPVMSSRDKIIEASRPKSRIEGNDNWSENKNESKEQDKICNCLK